VRGHRRTLSCIRCRERFYSEPLDAHHRTCSHYCARVRCVHPSKCHSPDSQSVSGVASDVASDVSEDSVLLSRLIQAFHRCNRKYAFYLSQKRRIPLRNLGGRERGTQTPLYPRNSTGSFANVLTPPTDHHHCACVLAFHKHFYPSVEKNKRRYNYGMHPP